MLVAGGCGTTEGDTTGADAASDAPNGSSDGADGGAGDLIDGAALDSADAGASGDCDVTSTSSLPGLTIRFGEPLRCVFTLAEAAAGITIPYDVTSVVDIDDVVPVPADEGACGQPGPSGLIVFEKLSGGGQSYCLCDVGLCARQTFAPRTVAAGSYAGAFTWDGRSWSGPSDTGNPKGPPFPPGDYVLSVSASLRIGTDADAKSYLVTSTLAIHIVP